MGGYIEYPDGPFMRRVQVTREIPDLWNSAPRLSPGRYRVTLEGEIKAEHPDLLYIDGGGSLHPSAVRSLAARFEKLRGPAPEWRPGDVITIRFANGSQAPEYTYVRGAREWPGERRNLTDAEVGRRWNQGKVRPVLQAGGQPFDEERLS